MTSALDFIRQARTSGDWQGVVDSVPYSQFLGLRVRVESGALLVEMPFADHLVGNASLPALHGGTLGALLESTAIYQALAAIETDALPKTINISVDYLRSAGPVTTFAQGLVTKHGRRVINVRVDAWQDERAKPVAVGNVHFLIS